MAMELMKRCNAELFAERASAEHTEQELKNELRGWLSPTRVKG